jgi:hypothetical protein
MINKHTLMIGLRFVHCNITGPLSIKSQKVVGINSAAQGKGLEGKEMIHPESGDLPSKGRGRGRTAIIVVRHGVPRYSIYALMMMM